MKTVHHELALIVHRFASDSSNSPEASDRPTGLLQGPPASRTSRPRPGRQSPALTSQFERTDSINSLEKATTFGTSAYNPSRGPSPLTIGMSDMIPVAVAFSETVNALFKGADYTK